MIRDFRQRFTRRKPDAAGDADPFQNRLANPGPVFEHVRAGGRIHMDEGFIDRILFHLRRELSERGDHPSGNVAVKFVVAGLQDQAGLRQTRLQLKKRRSHGDPEILALLRPADHAAVIVGKHGNSLPLERRIEDPFTRHIEVVAVHQPDHFSFPPSLNAVPTTGPSFRYR